MEKARFVVGTALTAMLLMPTVAVADSSVYVSIAVESVACCGGLSADLAFPPPPYGHSYYHWPSETSQGGIEQSVSSSSLLPSGDIEYEIQQNSMVRLADPSFQIIWEELQGSALASARADYRAGSIGISAIASPNLVGTYSARIRNVARVQMILTDGLLFHIPPEYDGQDVFIEFELRIHGISDAQEGLETTLNRASMRVEALPLRTGMTRYLVYDVPVGAPMAINEVVHESVLVRHWSDASPVVGVRLELRGDVQVGGGNMFDLGSTGSVGISAPPGVTFTSESGMFLVADDRDEADSDGDGIPDYIDNCPAVANADQSDLDGDGIGDACDPDIDGDGVPNDEDNCPFVYNPDQADFDGDGVGDACETDTDGDGIGDDVDQCPFTAQGEVADDTGCSIGQLCPCDNEWKNQGAYVSCVARTSERFVYDGLLTQTEKDAIVSGAAASQCGAKK